MPEPISSTVATGIKAVATPAISAAGAAAQSLGRRAFDQLKVNLTDCFNSHITSAGARCRNIQNVMYKDDPVDILTQYVDIQFISGTGDKTDSEVALSLTETAHYLISGKAGFGKTMFMKWATISLIDNKENHQLYPIFLELRYINPEEVGNGLERYIFSRASVKQGQSSFNQFKMGLEAGMFIVILDAVDEVSPNLRDIVISDIRNFAREYPKCAMLVSTRPDDGLESLQEFSVLRSKPMNKSQIISVISNLDYGEDVKLKLINELNSGLFEKHQEFLSNPLLATIMLLTYDHSADIPSKITSFYKEAFEVLYQRHDAHKGTFRRGHHAGLPMDEFELIFSIFCYKTYIVSKFEFSDTELLLAFREAVEFSGIKTNYALVVRDSIESASLIQKEGLDNTFVHRSFQEYFTALFISRYRGPDGIALLDAAALSIHGGNMLGMLMEINQDLLEYEWTLPKCRSWLSRVDGLKLKTKTGLRKFMILTFSSFGYNPETGAVSSYSLDRDTAARWMSPMGVLYPGNRFTSFIFEARLPKIHQLIEQVESRLGQQPKSFIDFVRNATDLSLSAADSSDRSQITPRDSDWLIATDIVRICEQIRTRASSLNRESGRDSVLRRNVIHARQEVDHGESVLERSSGSDSGVCIVGTFLS